VGISIGLVWRQTGWWQGHYYWQLIFNFNLTASSGLPYAQFQREVLRKYNFFMRLATQELYSEVHISNSCESMNPEMLRESNHQEQYMLHILTQAKYLSVRRTLFLQTVSSRKNGIDTKCWTHNLPKIIIFQLGNRSRRVI
jgi:hypothetical protein